MRVVAARFGDREAAAGVLRVLRERYGLGPGDADLAPLGAPTSLEERATLLAGRFHDEKVGEIVQLIERSDGMVVADIDEQWTRPRSARGELAAEGRSPGARGLGVGHG